MHFILFCLLLLYICFYIPGGKDKLDKLKKLSSAFHTLMDNFEVKKINWSPGNEITLSVEMGLSQGVEKTFRRSLSSIISENKSQGIQMTQDRLKISSEVVNRFFEKWIGLMKENILIHLASTECLSGASVLMVGGFSESKLLKQVVEDSFGQNRVIVPENPRQAVLKGAAMFGHKQDFILSRKSPYTYYILDLDNMKDCYENVNPKRLIRGKVAILVPIVQKDDVVELNKKIVKQCNLAVDGTTNVPLSLYFSNEDDITEDPHDEKVTKITTVEVPMPSHLEDKTITITFLFRGTDIKVTARNASGKSVEIY